MVLDIDTFKLYFDNIDTHTHTISIKNNDSCDTWDPTRLKFKKIYDIGIAKF